MFLWLQLKSITELPCILESCSFEQFTICKTTGHAENWLFIFMKWLETIACLNNRKILRSSYYHQLLNVMNDSINVYTVSISTILIHLFQVCRTLLVITTHLKINILLCSHSFYVWVTLNVKMNYLFQLCFVYILFIFMYVYIFSSYTLSCHLDQNK